MKSFISVALISLLLGTSISGCSSNNSKNDAAHNFNKKMVEQADATSADDVLNISDQIFDNTISKGVVMVDFWATWCGPCRIQGPIVDEIAKEMKGKVKVCKMDVDKNPSTSNRFKIEYIPTIIIFKDGKVIQSLTGLNQKEALIEILNNVLK